MVYDSRKVIHVVVLGQSQSGKSTLLKQIMNRPVEEVPLTASTPLLKKHGQVSMTFQEGPDHRTLDGGVVSHLKRAHAAVFAVDLSSPDCLKDLENLYFKLNRDHEAVHVLIALTKSDLVSEEVRQERTGQIKSFAVEHAIDCFEWKLLTKYRTP